MGRAALREQRTGPPRRVLLMAFKRAKMEGVIRYEYLQGHCNGSRLYAGGLEGLVQHATRDGESWPRRVTNIRDDKSGGVATVGRVVERKAGSQEGAGIGTGLGWRQSRAGTGEVAGMSTGTGKGGRGVWAEIGGAIGTGSPDVHEAGGVQVEGIEVRRKENIGESAVACSSGAPPREE